MARRAALHPLLRLAAFTGDLTAGTTLQWCLRGPLGEAYGIAASSFRVLLQSWGSTLTHRLKL